jgi:hypothetical protein
MSTTMITTATTTATQSPARTSRRVLWTAGLLSGAVASVATTVMAAVASAADVALTIDGEEIPLLGFAQMTMLGAVIGTVLAWSFSRWASRPRRTFVVTTVVLTALSLVPDLLVNASTTTKLVLMATHVVAAAIVVPPVAKRLSA